MADHVTVTEEELKPCHATIASDFARINTVLECSPCCSLADSDHLELAFFTTVTNFIIVVN